MERVDLPGFFRRGIPAWPRRAADTWKIWRRTVNTPRALVIVQGDLPRVLYLLLQLRVPLIFIRQDGILTCPGNNRFLARSRAVCREPLSLACLRIHRREACLGSLSWPRQVGRLVFRLRDRLLLRWMRHFVANSAYIVRAHDRPGLVLYPTRQGGPEPAAASERDLHRLAFCGRLEEVKGAADAIRILSLLPEAFHLEILGDGPERGRLGKAVRDLQLGHRVRFRGWVDAAARDKCLAASGVLLMPSLWDEAFGMAGLEALAQGTPVVAYDVGGVSEWCCRGAGVLVQCGDIRRAAMAVRRLTENPARWAANSRAAKRVADRRFAPVRFGQELERVLKEATG